ncbi:MAG: sigma-70 family RNA polymerase sigma factor [Cyanobacteria bacterium P01_G01_bin.54]
MDAAPLTPAQLNNDQLNAELKRLARQAQDNPEGSPLRQRSLNQLLRLLQASGKLRRPYPHQFNYLYEEIYAEALQRLFIYICQKIDLYRPEKEVLQWVNFMLKTRFFYEARQDCVPFYRPERQKLSRQPWLRVEELEQTLPGKVPRAAPPTLEDQARDYIESDPDGCLTQKHLRGHPEITLQILLLRILAGYKWHELAQEFAVPLPTLHSFYSRQLQKCMPQLREYLAP